MFCSPLAHAQGPSWREAPLFHLQHGRHLRHPLSEVLLWSTCFTAAHELLRGLCAQIAATLAHTDPRDAGSNEGARAAQQRSQLLHELLKDNMRTLAAPATSKRDAAIAARALGELARATRLFLGAKVNCFAQVCSGTISASGLMGKV